PHYATLYTAGTTNLSPLPPASSSASSSPSPFQLYPPVDGPPSLIYKPVRSVIQYWPVQSDSGQPPPPPPGSYFGGNSIESSTSGPSITGSLAHDPNGLLATNTSTSA